MRSSESWHVRFNTPSSNNSLQPRHQSSVKSLIGVGRYLLPFFLACIVALVVASPVLAQWSNGYTYQRAITISHTEVPNTDQTNFPVLISGTYSYLATISNSGSVTNSNGYDIIFTSDPGGVNPLPYERESYSATTGAINFWVMVPTVSHSADTTIYLFYGNASISTDQSNATAVWDSNYQGVWHLPNGTTLSANDSTMNGNNGSITGATATPGEIGGAASFNGSSQYIDVGNGSGLQITVNQITVEAWIKTSESDPSAYERIAVKELPGNNPPYVAYGLYRVGGSISNEIQMAMSNGSTINAATSSSSISMGSWTHLVGTYDGSNLKIYLNGVLSNTAAQTGNINSTTQNVVIGADTALGAEYFNGSIDEVRISNTARSADWIATEYNNQSSPSAFYTIGSANNGGCGGTSSSWSNGYSYRRAITISHSEVPNTDQADFPILISGTYSYLATVGNGGNVTNSNGYDIAFACNGSGTTPLAYERETYNSSNGNVNLWVKVPVVSHTSDTVIYMFYGNSTVTTDQSDSTDVWDSNYQGVWHLPNGSTLSANDSTDNGNNGSITGATATTGEIGGAANLNGSSQYIDVGNSSGLQITGNQITVEAWVKTSESDPSPYERIVVKELPGNNPPYIAYGLYRVGGSVSNEVQWGITNGSTLSIVTSLSSIPMGSWTHLVGTYDGSNVRVYLNGVLSNSIAQSGNINSTTQDVVIGADTAEGAVSELFNGSIDEVRISDTARSADWIATEYNNQSSPSTFYSIGSASSGGSVWTGPILESLYPTEGPVGTTVTLYGDNFGSSGTVKFNGQTASSVTWTSTTQITATVPTGATSGDVVVTVSGVPSEGDYPFTVTGAGTPTISYLSTSQGPVGTSVTIYGSGFGSSGSVSFNGTAASTTSWSSTSISTTVPSGATTGDVIVAVSSVNSNGSDFVVTSSGDSSSSDIYFYFSDALGTSRIVTTSDGTVCYDADLYPFGGERAYVNNCNPNHKFTGKERDSESGLDNSQARYYSSQFGRFMSPDPMNIGADPTSPQSWNMYSYVLNNPLRFIDPTGGYTCVYITDDGGYVEETDINSSAGECSATGGQEGVDDQTITVNGDDGSCQMSDAMCQQEFSELNNQLQPPQGVFACASEAASKVSIAGMLQSVGVGRNGVGGFITNALGGNTFSGASDLLQSIATGSGGGHSVFYNMAQGVAAGPSMGLAAALPKSLQDTPWTSGPVDVVSDAIAKGANALINNGATLTDLAGEVSTAGLTGAEYATGVGELKLGYDAVTYFGSLMGCGLGVIK